MAEPRTLLSLHLHLTDHFPGDNCQHDNDADYDADDDDESDDYDDDDAISYKKSIEERKVNVLTFPAWFAHPPCGSRPRLAWLTIKS